LVTGQVRMTRLLSCGLCVRCDFTSHRACLPDRRCNVGLLDDQKSITREGTPSAFREAPFPRPIHRS
jgi:hypothetical protein